MTNGWVPLLDQWLLTPQGSHALGRNIDSPDGFDFEVTVTWREGQVEAWTTATFRVAFSAGDYSVDKINETRSANQEPMHWGVV